MSSVMINLKIYKRWQLLLMSRELFMMQHASALLRTLPLPASNACATVASRALASKAHLARGKRLRRGGPIPGIHIGGKLSTEMQYRSESVLESIRRPRPHKEPIKKWRVLRGDTVHVISGRESGKTGRVLEVVRASNSVVVEGANIVRKFVRTPGTERMQPVYTEAPIFVSRVAVVCPQSGRPTRVGFRFLDDGTKVRVAKISGAIIPRPEILRLRRKPRAPDSVKCTPAAVVLRRTFEDEHGLYEKYEGFKALIEEVVDEKPS